jgi:hypothetical protein
VGESCVLFALRRGHTQWPEEVAMEIVHARCCGLDVHKKSVVACVLISESDGLIERQVRTFKTMTADLLELADWLHSLGVTYVALESTGVYWRPVFNILEDDDARFCSSTRSTCGRCQARKRTSATANG